MTCCKGALCSEKTLLKATYRRLPGGLVVRIRRSHRRGRGSIPRLGRSLLLPEAKFPSRRESIVVVQSRSYDHLCSMHVWDRRSNMYLQYAWRTHVLQRKTLASPQPARVLL